ncbi:MAG: hypothetical protein ACREQR_13860 [Candidatus Binataceae bacterium]
MKLGWLRGRGNLFRADERRFASRCAAALLIALAPIACTHLLQTDTAGLPGRMQRGDFSFQRPDRPGWYLRDTVDPPALAEFTRHDGRAESQLLIYAFDPQAPVTNAEQLQHWAESLPGGNKIVSAAPGHGTTCLRYHARSELTVNYANTPAPSADRMITDEDSLECLDTRTPGFIVRFIYTQRSPSGGTPAGNREADALLNSIQFE